MGFVDDVVGEIEENVAEDVVNIRINDRKDLEDVYGHVSELLEMLLNEIYSNISEDRICKLVYEMMEE